jgi:hypothetical protein
VWSQGGELASAASHRSEEQRFDHEHGETGEHRRECDGCRSDARIVDDVVGPARRVHRALIVAAAQIRRDEVVRDARDIAVVGRSGCDLNKNEVECRRLARVQRARLRFCDLRADPETRRREAAAAEEREHAAADDAHCNRLCRAGRGAIEIDRHAGADRVVRVRERLRSERDLAGTHCGTSRDNRRREQRSRLGAQTDGRDGLTADDDVTVFAVCPRDDCGVAAQERVDACR